jgi:sterol desaturase/sphingolipid hydroxylase (fatty acid hydroxylase superfamily)
MLSQFHAIFLTVLRLSVWLTILVIIFVPLEQLFAVRPKKILRKGIVTDLGYFFITSLLPAALLSGPTAMLAWLIHAAIPNSFLAITSAWPLWLKAVVALIASEVGYYWAHRLSHEIPFLWRFHAIHHSAEEVDFLVNTRAHPIDFVFGRFCALVPVYVLGLGNPQTPSGSLVPIIATLITTTWGFFIHANIRWRFGPLEWIVSTPAFHHWHHTLSGPINRNYSSTLPWLDRIFGTHYLPKEFPAAYGTETKLPDSLTDQLLYPFQKTAQPQPTEPQPSELRPDPASAPQPIAASEGGANLK